jgi:hypothetical protein
LACGIKPSDFAQELLALASTLPGSRLSTLLAMPMGSMPMFGRGALEDRLRGILDQRRSRAATTTAAVCLATALAVTAIAPLAMLRAAPPKPLPSAGDSGLAGSRGDATMWERGFMPGSEDDPKPIRNRATPPGQPAKRRAEVLEALKALNRARLEGVGDGDLDTRIKQYERAYRMQTEAQPPGEKSLTIRGQVVDDATGKPIEQFTAQAGMFDTADPARVIWGYREERFNAGDGSFSMMIRWGEGWI